MRKRLPRERWDEVLKSEACFDPGLEAAVTNSSRRRNLSCRNFSSANETLRTKRPAREPIAVAVILIAGFLIRFPGILSNGFLSDESIYAYAAYAIGRGVTPYSQIMLAHPPIGYLVLIPSALLAQGNLLVLRTFNLSTYLLDAGICYWLFRILRSPSPASIHPLLGLALFALYPLPFATTTPLEFTIFDVPILLGTVFFVRGLEKGSNSRLAVSGVLLGIAVMIWFTALFFAVSLLGFLAIYQLKARRNRFLELFPKQAACLVVGGAAAILLVLGLMITWRAALPNFIVQSLGLQTSLRPAFTFVERVYHIEQAIWQLLPIFILATVGSLEIVRRVKSGADPMILLPAWVLIANLVMVFAIPRIVLNHYVAYLTPFLVCMTTGPVEKIAKQILLTLRKRARLVPWDYFHGAMVIGLVVSAVVIFPYQSGFLSNSPYTLANQAIGHYVASITLEGNAIWTSEGSIAFFASRLIQPPNSTQWPFQAAYNDIFNTTYVDADGVTHEGLGAVSPSEFVEAWQSHNTTVLVFILGTGPVPYPDDFLWYGFPGTEGVSRWVNSNYQLVSAPTFPNVGYQYFIWLRR